MLNTSGVMRAFCFVILILCLQLPVNIVSGARLVKKDQRTLVIDTQFGSISTVDIDDGSGRNKYHLQFITMEPNSLFLPVLLHADMVFYVHSGSGTLSLTEGKKSDNMNEVSLQKGDLYRLRSNSLFYLNSTLLDPESPKFKIIAIFTNPDEQQLQGPSVGGPYSSINDLVRSFDKPVLQAAFQVSQEVIEELTNSTGTAAIVHVDEQSRKKLLDEKIMLLNAMFGIQRFGKQEVNKKKKYTKTFNFYKEAPDFQNCNGWSKVVTKHDLHALQGSQIEVYMVNLTKGSMMGPHWNPSAAEVSVVLDGEGMVQVVCPSTLTNKECKSTRVRVEGGDVLGVPKFHPMAQMSFNNGSLVFIGFSATSKKNQPQFLAGKASILQTLDESIIGVSLNVSNTTVSQLLAAENESILLDCTNCAEELEMLIEEEKETGGEGEPAVRQQEDEKHEEEQERREESGRDEKEERGRKWRNKA